MPLPLANTSPAEATTHRLKRITTWIESRPEPAVRLALIVLGALLIARLAVYTWVFAVNIPFSDQMSYLAILFDGFQWRDIPAAFVWQHGPPRLGVSFALLVPLYELSGWNIRLDSMLITCTLIAAGACALRLRRRLLPGPWTLWDATLLFGFWALNVFESIVVTPLNSHSIFPLLLVMIIANVWIAAPSWRRTGSLIVLTFCAAFTGFGISVVPALGLVLLLQIWRTPNGWRDSVPILVGLMATIWLFLIGYQFVVAADNFKVVQPNPLSYVRFAIVMFNYFFLLFHPAYQATFYPVGLVFGAVVAGIAIRSAWTLARRHSPALTTADTRFFEICLLLCTTTMTFVAWTAYGRVQLGIYGANTPRYMTLIIPALSAFYFWLRRDAGDGKRMLTLALLGALVLRIAPEIHFARDRGRYYSNIKLCWFEAYRRHYDWQEANETVRKADGRHNFLPVWMGSPEQWQYMRSHRLGPFNPNVAVSVLERFEAEPCGLLH